MDKADGRVTEAIVRESDQIMRATSRDHAEWISRQGEPPSVVRECTAESAPSAADGSRPPPPQNNQRAPMGRGGGRAETRRLDRGKKRAVSGDLGEEDQRESISRRLPDEGRGHKRSSDCDGDDSDLRENISRGLPDDSGQPAPPGAPQQYGLDLAGTVTIAA